MVKIIETEINKETKKSYEGLYRKFFYAKLAQDKEEINEITRKLREILAKDQNKKERLLEFLTLNKKKTTVIMNSTELLTEVAQEYETRTGRKAFVFTKESKPGILVNGFEEFLRGEKDAFFSYKSLRGVRFPDNTSMIHYDLPLTRTELLQSSRWGEVSIIKTKTKFDDFLFEKLCGGNLGYSDLFIKR